MGMYRNSQCRLFLWNIYFSPLWISAVFFPELLKDMPVPPPTAAMCHLLAPGPLWTIKKQREHARWELQGSELTVSQQQSPHVIAWHLSLLDLNWGQVNKWSLTILYKPLHIQPTDLLAPSTKFIRDMLRPHLYLHNATMLILTMSLSFLLWSYCVLRKTRFPIFWFSVGACVCTTANPKGHSNRGTYARPSVSDGTLHFVTYK